MRKQTIVTSGPPPPTPRIVSARLKPCRLLRRIHPFRSAEGRREVRRTKRLTCVLVPPPPLSGSAKISPGTFWRIHLLTKEQILTTADDEALLDLLSAELNRRLPPEIQNDGEALYAALPSLPRGLRAMAGMHFFDVSMTLDDLAWHFGNQNDERALRETWNGLIELELTRIAELFRAAWLIMEPHLDTIRNDQIEGDPHDWLEEIGAQHQIDPMNDEIWAFCKSEGKLGLLHSWPRYARNYPERCVDTLN